MIQSIRPNIRGRTKILLLALGLVGCLLPSLFLLKTENKTNDDFQYWFVAVNRFFQGINPQASPIQRYEFARAIYGGTGGNITACCYLGGIAVKETSLRMRKYQPEVKQNKDYLGAHNEVYFSELKAQGLIGDYRIKGKSRGPNCWTPEAREWLTTLSDNPEFGTMLMSMWFMRLVRKNGMDYRKTVKQWKFTGEKIHSEYIATLCYWNDVKWFAVDLDEMYRRAKEENK